MIVMDLQSRKAIEGPARAPHRAMYKAMGLTNEDLDRPAGTKRKARGKGRRLHSKGIYHYCSF